MRSPIPTRFVAALPRRVALAAALFLSVAVAQAVSISPVVVELSPTRRIASITFTNPGKEAIRYQAKARSWHQVQGVDSYEDSEQLIVSPPIAEIAAGGTQIFRIALRGQYAPREQAFRILFEDVTATAAAQSDGVAIKVRINHDLPVFVAVAGHPAPQLHMGPCQGKAPRTACVRMDNSGDRYAQVRILNVERGSWHTQMTVNDRVLAGAWREWQLKLPPGSSGPIRVSTTSIEGGADKEVSVSLP